MYKLICIDMDGTLLNDEKKISKENKEAVRKAFESGIKVVVCTGRIFTSAEYYSDLLEVKTPVIASNGAYIREKDRDDVIYQGVLGYENCRLCVEVCRKYGLYAHFYTPDTIFTEKIIYSSESYSRFNNLLPDERKIKIKVVEDWDETIKDYKEDILKCIAIDEDGEKIRKAKEEISQSCEVEVVTSFENNFEVMSKGVSKGRAVEILAGYYGIDRSEIICIGDNENDLSMIKYAGLGVAMGNAPEFIKTEADFITDTNNSNGVAKVIETYILNNNL